MDFMCCCKKKKTIKITNNNNNQSENAGIDNRGAEFMEVVSILLIHDFVFEIYKLFKEIKKKLIKQS